MTEQAGKIEIREIGATAAILFAIWAAGLLVAFLAYRGADLGQLPALLGGLASGGVFGVSGFGSSLAGLLIAVFIFLAWFGLGSTIVSFVAPPPSESKWLNLAISTATGAAAWSLIWFFIGLAGAYSKVTALVALVIGVAFAVWRLGGSLKGKPGDENKKSSSIFEKFLLIATIVPVVLALIASLAPPTAKDALLYHFAVPKVFIAQGSSAFVEGNIASYLPLGTEMHVTWAMLVGTFFGPRVSEAAAGATVFLFFPVLLLAIYGWARELKVDKVWALLAVFIFASIPTAYYVAASSYIDLALALYVTLAIFALGRWWQTPENKWLVFTAIFLGAALSVKLTALFVFAAAALVILLRARQSKDEAGRMGKILGGGSAALIAGGLIASPWYLRTWKETGSPIFPFYMNIWKGQAAGWDVERSGFFQLMNSRYGGASKGVLDYLLSPFKISLLAQPEQALFFDGVIGAIFLFALPILIWALWKFSLPVEIKVGLGICLVMFLFWLFSSEQLRYLLPVFPALAVAICVACETISKSSGLLQNVWKGSVAVLGLAAMLTGAAWFLQKDPLKVVFGGEPREEYLARVLDYYPYYQTVNTETPLEAKVWLINMRRDSYDLERPYFSDYLFEDWTLKKLLWESKDTAELKQKIGQMGINYILVRHDVLLDYAQSGVLDDKKTKPENEAKLQILKDIFFDGANTVRSDKKFSLVKIS